ncbi:MAG: hypothetical protein JXB30_00815 [Anaerolineae bacterium]|nr:hypothetical protein [Anaerolineae bacterium]
MSRNTKIVLGIIGALVILCVVVIAGAIIAVSVMGESIVENMIIEDPAEVAEAADKIADYELPPGYEERMVMNIIFGKMLLIGPEDQSDKPMITLMQISSIVGSDEMDQEQYRQQMQQSMELQASQREMYMQLVDESEVEIAGQEVTLMTYEGDTDYGGTMRQVVSDIFEVNDSLIMLMIMGEIESWPESDLEAFIESIQ